MNQVSSVGFGEVIQNMHSHRTIWPSVKHHFLEFDLQLGRRYLVYFPHCPSSRRSNRRQMKGEVIMYHVHAPCFSEYQKNISSNARSRTASDRETEIAECKP